jgi:LmbE family N-acetylglucosaminyl deacetylase
MAVGKLVVIGAHPDDCELIGGGMAILFRRSGWDVTFLTMTNGDAGHHQMTREALRQRRKAEAETSARLLGVDCVIMDNHDGQLEPTLAVREELIRVLRRIGPDMVITHPPVDYHPDHRYTSQIVGDTSFLLEVPMICPDVPAMTKSTAYLYCYGDPVPEKATIFPVAIDAMWEQVMAATMSHESQMFEWLPYVCKWSGEIPGDSAGRLAYVSSHFQQDNIDLANRFRDRLKEFYGAEAGDRVRLAEAYYQAPFGRRLTEDEIGIFASSIA